MAQELIYTRIVLKGRVPSKKNNRRNFGNFSIPSKAYEKWHKEQIGQMPQIPTLFPPYRVKISCQPGTWHDQDLSNIESSVLDLLVEALILQDDNRWALTQSTLINLPFVKGQTLTIIEIWSSPTPCHWKDLKATAQLQAKPPRASKKKFLTN